MKGPAGDGTEGGWAMARREAGDGRKEGWQWHVGRLGSGDGT